MGFLQNLERLNEPRDAPLNQSYPGVEALGALLGVDDLHKANLLKKEGLVSHPSSNEIYGYASNQNLRSFMNNG